MSSAESEQKKDVEQVAPASAGPAGEKTTQRSNSNKSNGESKKNGGGGSGGPAAGQENGPIMVARNKSGVVKWFSFKNGYGFITVDGEGEDDIFVHRSEFIREGAREVFYHVDVGDRLEFDIINRAKGREAVAVTGPNGVRIPGSPAKFSRRRPNSEQRPRQQEDHFEDAQQEQPNGEGKKRGGRGGRRRNASGEGGQQDNEPQQGDGGNGDAPPKQGGGRRRSGKNSGGRGAQSGDQPQQQEEAPTAQ